MTTSALHWFRRDLRLADNKALAAALGNFERVHCVFVFDTEILDALAGVPIVGWNSSCAASRNSPPPSRSREVQLIVLHGAASEEIPRLARQLQVECVFANRDYEPAAIARDAKVDQALSGDGIAFIRIKDQVIFEQDEILSGEGRPYAVFGAYRKAWLKRLPDADLEPAASADGRGRLAPQLQDGARPAQPAATLGFEATNLLQVGVEPGGTGAERRAAGVPAAHAGLSAGARPSRAETACRTCRCTCASARSRSAAWCNEALREGSDGARAWLDELIWRDFYFSILYLFPHVVGQRLQARARASRLHQPAGSLRRMVRRPDRLSAGGRRHAPAEPDRLHAQPPADGDRILPGQGPAGRLALGRALLRRPS